MHDSGEPETPGLSAVETPAPTGGSVGSWRHMVESNRDLLRRKTGQDTDYWVQHAREAGVETDRDLREWMRDEFGVTGYAQYAVSWEMFGYPDFMLQDPDQLINGQYANHPQLRPIADAILKWAFSQTGVHIQMRKGFVSLHSPRRKFAQVTRSTKRIVDVTLRLDAETGGRVERIKARSDDPFTSRVRLTAPEQVDNELLALLSMACEQNS